MTKRKAMQWVKALRSGKYKQGGGNLRKESLGKVTHCCLGVLGEISGIDSDDLVNRNYLDGGRADICGLKTKDATLFNKFSDIIRIKIKKGSKYVKVNNLAEANDAGVSFKSIASWIEKNYKLL